MEATFIGRLGQKMHMTGSPDEVAMAYAFLIAADIQSIKAMDQARLKEEEQPKEPPKTGRYPMGGYSEPPFELLNGSTESIINGLLDWVNDQLKNNRGQDGDKDGD